MNQVREQVLKSIVNSNGASTSPQHICEAIQCPPRVVEDCLLDLETSNMVTVWESETGIAVTLTPLGATRLNVHLVDYSGNSVWKPINEPLSANYTSGFPGGFINLSLTRTDAENLTADPGLGPSEQAILNEEIGTILVIPEGERKNVHWKKTERTRFDEFGLPYPNRLLGAGTALWDNMKYDSCPGCQGRELETCEYCLRCDRWGMDPYLDKTFTEIKIHSYPQHKAEKVNPKRRLEDVRKRKDKHKRRMQAKTLCNT